MFVFKNCAEECLSVLVFVKTFVKRTRSRIGVSESFSVYCVLCESRLLRVRAHFVSQLSLLSRIPVITPVRIIERDESDGLRAV